MMALLRMIIEHGGLSVVLIALASLAAVTVAVERTWRLLPLRRRFEGVRATCNDALLRAGPREALALLQGDDPMSRVLRAGLMVHERGPETVRAAAHNRAQREVAGLERGLGIIQIAAQIAPWLGLMGTVLGLMEVFQHAGQGAAASSLAEGPVGDGIAKALGATVAGLVVAIATYTAYGMLSGLSSRLVDDLETSAADLPIFLAAMRPGAA